MAIKDTLIKLGKVREDICVTISLNTHRTHPDNLTDEIELKKLVSQAQKTVIERYGKRPGAAVLDKLGVVESLINRDYNLDSLHVFISDSSMEILRLAWPTTEDRVIVADSFDVRTVLKASNRTEDYFILLLSQGGVHLYHALNDKVTEEYRTKPFPFAANPHYTTVHVELSNAKLMDDQVREYFNTVDKAVVKVCQETGLKCLVIGTEENYGKLLQVADVPSTYMGFSAIDYNHTKDHELAWQAWPAVQKLQQQRWKAAIDEMKEAVGSKEVLTDLNDIYTAVNEGRGDILIARDDYVQPVKIDADGRLTLSAKEGADIDDIASYAAWEVFSKGGQVFFTCLDDIKDLGDIVLRTRY